MFTGLVECMGEITEIDFSLNPVAITIKPEPHRNRGFKAELGDSIAIDGVCLTVAEFKPEKSFQFQIGKETLDLTTLSKLKAGYRVNLERAMMLNSRLGGHIVLGHVDGIGTVKAKQVADAGWLYRISLEKFMARYVISKGSICINGVSLTINTVSDYPSEVVVEIMLIPTTLKETNLGKLEVGSIVNIEVDMMGKYIERLFSLSSGDRM